jgi:hypothetical protein
MVDWRRGSFSLAPGAGAGLYFVFVLFVPCEGELYLRYLSAPLPPIRLGSFRKYLMLVGNSDPVV